VFARHASVTIAKKTAEKTPVFPSLINDSPRIDLFVIFTAEKEVQAFS
jgi:hypothetical protein